jgi:cell division transport system ATP-binding protein
MQLFFHINATGSTVVMATHNRDIVDLARRRVVALDRGAIVRDDVTGKYHEEIAASALRA